MMRTASLALQLATTAAFSAGPNAARASMLGVRSGEREAEHEMGSSTSIPVGLGGDIAVRWWPSSSWTSPFWPTTTMLTYPPGHSHSSTSTSTRSPTTPGPGPTTGTESTGTPTPPGSGSTSTSAAASTRSSPSETLVTDMPSSTGAGTTFSTTTGVGPGNTGSTSGDTSDLGSNRTLVITLSSVLSGVAVLLVIGAVVLCWRYRQRRLPFFARGISPIDDEEIATWKVPRSEKAFEHEVEAADSRAGASRPGHAKQASTSSKKPPSVIVYSNAHGQGRPSVEGSPPGSYGYYRKMSLDRDLPPTPIQARAPNAVAGLTDESVPGADPFVSTPRRHPSRLSKPPPALTSPRSGHSRTRSSRSSMRSFGEYGGYYGSSELELSPRGSQDYMRPHHGHSRVYSTSELPPRLSLGDDGVVGGLSPRPTFREEDIGRAIG